MFGLGADRRLAALPGPLGLHWEQIKTARSRQRDLVTELEVQSVNHFLIAAEDAVLS